MSVIEHALARLGHREYVEDAATVDPAELEYARVVRRCNGRHDWSFARVLGRKLAVRRGKAELPPDVLTLLAVKRAGGEKVRHFSLGVDAQTRRRLLRLEYGEGEVFIDYTADLVALGWNLPDEAPAFCDGVIALLAAAMAPRLGAGQQMRLMLEQEGEEKLREAILIDARQDKSNDQHPLRGILRGQVLRAPMMMSAEDDEHYL